MATPRLSMRNIREILRQKWSLNRSHREVAAGLNISIGGVSKIVGKPGITLSKLRLTRDGQPAGVYYLGLSLDWMERAIARTRLQEGARLSVLDGRGTLVARFPDPERWAGTAVQGQVVRQVLDSAAEGTLQDVNRLGERFIDEAPGPVDLHYDPISRAISAQPEGIAFDADGNLHLSSEGKKGEGLILKFNYIKK